MSVLGGPTTVKQFKELIASIPEECDDYRVMSPGWQDLEWVALYDNNKHFTIAFGNYPDEYPIEMERYKS